VTLIDRVEATLADAFGFAEVAVGRRLDGGYANDLFVVNADGRKLVLRVKRPPVDEADVAWEHGLTQLLSTRLGEVVAPVPTRDGRTFVALANRVAWLMPFIDGGPADAHREQHRLAAARALARLHRVGRDLELPPRPRLSPLMRSDWPPAVTPDELARWRATIARSRNWAASFVATVARDRN
jgi:Ser/Thr protein kinase RdoA (MazF antagonist)